MFKYLLFSNDSIDSQLNFTESSTLPLIVPFSGHPSFFLFCLLIVKVKDIIVDTSIHVKDYWSFLISINLYINKKHFGHSIAFNAATV